MLVIKSCLESAWMDTVLLQGLLSSGTGVCTLSCSMYLCTRPAGVRTSPALRTLHYNLSFQSSSCSLLVSLLLNTTQIPCTEAERSKPPAGLAWVLELVFCSTVEGCRLLMYTQTICDVSGMSATLMCLLLP